MKVNPCVCVHGRWLKAGIDLSMEYIYTTHDRLSGTEGWTAGKQSKVSSDNHDASSLV